MAAHPCSRLVLAWGYCCPSPASAGGCPASRSGAAGDPGGRYRHMADNTTQSQKRPVILCAGGTGGHLFPAEALAAELLSRDIPVVIFTDKRGHAFKSLGDRAPIYIIRAATLKPG